MPPPPLPLLLLVLLLLLLLVWCSDCYKWWWWRWWRWRWQWRRQNGRWTSTVTVSRQTTKQFCHFFFNSVRTMTSLCRCYHCFPFTVSLYALSIIFLHSITIDDDNNESFHCCLWDWFYDWLLPLLLLIMATMSEVVHIPLEPTLFILRFLQYALSFLFLSDKLIHSFILIQIIYFFVPLFVFSCYYISLILHLLSIALFTFTSIVFSLFTNPSFPSFLLFFYVFLSCVYFPNFHPPFHHLLPIYLTNDTILS